MTPSLWLDWTASAVTKEGFECYFNDIEIYG